MAKILLVPLNVLLTTPFIRPFRFGRILFTYIIPLLPLLFIGDGLVSVMRTYSVHEMKQVVSSLHGSDRFEWEIGQRRRRGLTNMYLLGTPKRTSNNPI